jgi:hypothetical protein
VGQIQISGSVDIIDRDHNVHLRFLLAEDE